MDNGGVQVGRDRKEVLAASGFLVWIMLPPVILLPPPSFKRGPGDSAYYTLACRAIFLDSNTRLSTGVVTSSRRQVGSDRDDKGLYNHILRLGVEQRDPLGSISYEFC